MAYSDSCHPHIEHAALLMPFWNISFIMILLTLFAIVLLSSLAVSHPLSEREDEIQGRAIFQETSFIIDQHSRARELMITLEKTQRQGMSSKLNPTNEPIAEWCGTDAQFRDGLSPACKHADRIVKKIREEDIKVHWNGTNGFAGEMFPLARPKIANTTLWKIVKGMPKGALLHAHLSAMLPYNTLLSAIIKADMLFQANESLGTPEGRQRATVTFWPPAYAVKNVDITSEDYKGQRVNISHAIVQFPGGESAFREFIVSKLVLPPKVATQHELGVDEIWRRFQPLFSSASTFFTYQPVVQVFWQNLFAELAEDKISWVEIRSGGSTSKLIKPDATVSDDADGKQWWDLMVQELDKFTVKHNSTWQQERLAPFYGARVIWSDQRGKPTADILKSMRSALDMKKNYRKLFSGYDLVSQEDLGRTLLDLAPELLWFQQQAKEDNLILPFFFHAGETLGDGNSTDLNLFDAVLLGTRRIGHGFSLYKHPELIQAVKKKNIMVEVCPISNEVLQLSTDILHHPLPAMIAHGVTTALSNDDPAMLGQDAAGLSYDFYQVIQGFDNVGLAGLGALAQNSLRWSNFEDQDDKEWGLDIELGEVGMGTKGLRIKEWNSLFDAYCHEIVNKHNGTYGG